MIVSDDQGYADLGCCGRPELVSPNLDRLAAEHTRNRLLCRLAGLHPSRGALLTGRYPQRNGLYDMIRNDVADFKVTFTDQEYAVTPEAILGLDERETVIAEVLKKAGYATGVVGKWDSGQLRRFRPTQRGFDFFYGFCNTGVDYWTHERYEYPSMWRNNERIVEDGYITDLFEREALGFLRAHADERFFLYLPFNAPHGGSNFSSPARRQSRSTSSSTAACPAASASTTWAPSLRWMSQSAPSSNCSNSRAVSTTRS
ncbi:MAG: sulfatase-like hydrolase/transferase [Bryobacterales bacterium]